MSYLEVTDVRAWVQESKYRIPSVKPELESTAKETVFAKVAQRYDTSTWVDSDTTPTLILRILSMLVAAYELRAYLGEDADESSQPAWLERRAEELCDDIVSGAVELLGVDVDSTSTLGGSAVFFPDDASTALGAIDPYAEGAAPRMFDSQQYW